MNARVQLPFSFVDKEHPDWNPDTKPRRKADAVQHHIRQMREVLVVAYGIVCCLLCVVFGVIVMFVYTGLQTMRT